MYICLIVIRNGNKKTVFPNFGIGNGIENIVPNFWYLKRKWETVFLTQAGEILTKESLEKVGNKNSCSCLLQTTNYTTNYTIHTEHYTHSKAQLKINISHCTLQTAHSTWSPHNQPLTAQLLSWAAWTILYSCTAVQLGTTAVQSVHCE